MGIPYFENKSWAEITREERYFCAILYFHASKNPKDFANWIIDTANLNTDHKLDSNGDWELGYEVCLYRDYLWHKDKDNEKPNKFSRKRTFDLCLFGEKAVIIIEAKVHERFRSDQIASVSEDRENIKDVLGEKLKVKAVALASNTYFENQEEYGKDGLLNGFNGRITWEQLAIKYNNPCFWSAAKIYNSQARLLRQC